MIINMTLAACSHSGAKTIALWEENELYYPRKYPFTPHLGKIYPSLMLQPSKSIVFFPSLHFLISYCLIIFPTGLLIYFNKLLRHAGFPHMNHLNQRHLLSTLMLKSFLPVYPPPLLICSHTTPNCSNLDSSAPLCIHLRVSGGFISWNATDEMTWPHPCLGGYVKQRKQKLYELK